MGHIFTMIGAFVVILAAAGALGIGHFNLYYGAGEYSCTKTK
jgi:hypothetical protein